VIGVGVGAHRTGGLGSFERDHPDRKHLVRCECPLCRTPAIFSGHSLRAGFVTSALEHGADLFKVMDVTRHRRVETLKGYDRRAKAFRDHAGRGFCDELVIAARRPLVGAELGGHDATADICFAPFSHQRSRLLRAYHRCKHPPGLQLRGISCQMNEPLKRTINPIGLHRLKKGHVFQERLV
jgi:hypothetical protein